MVSSRWDDLMRSYRELEELSAAGDLEAIELLPEIEAMLTEEEARVLPPVRPEPEPAPEPEPQPEPVVVKQPLDLGIAWAKGKQLQRARKVK